MPLMQHDTRQSGLFGRSELAGVDGAIVTRPEDRLSKMSTPFIQDARAPGSVPDSQERFGLCAC